MFLFLCVLLRISTNIWVKRIQISSEIVFLVSYFKADLDILENIFGRVETWIDVKSLQNKRVWNVNCGP